MELLNCVVTPRPDLHLEWHEVQIDDALFLEHNFPPGTTFTVDGKTFQTIEEALPGSPVMCRVIEYNHQRTVDLLAKYAEAPQERWPSWIKNMILRRLKRR